MYFSLGASLYPGVIRRTQSAVSQYPNLLEGGLFRRPTIFAPISIWKCRILHHRIGSRLLCFRDLYGIAQFPAAALTLSGLDFH